MAASTRSGRRSTTTRVQLNTGTSRAGQVAVTAASANHQTVLPQPPPNALATSGTVDPALLSHDISTMWVELQQLRQQVTGAPATPVAAVAPPPAGPAVATPAVHAAPSAPVVATPTAVVHAAPTQAAPAVGVPAVTAGPPAVPYPYSRFHSAGTRSIAKPKGSAGGGKKGFHLRDAMGLDDTAEGVKRYNMILSTVRELAHAARLNFLKSYREASHGDLHSIFASARHIHPYLSIFQNDWATAEILKQFMGNVRRYGKKRGYFSLEPSA